jgi:hypothetical protein
MSSWSGSNQTPRCFGRSLMRSHITGNVFGSRVSSPTCYNEDQIYLDPRGLRCPSQALSGLGATVFPRSRCKTRHAGSVVAMMRGYLPRIGVTLTKY